MYIPNDYANEPPTCVDCYNVICRCYDIQMRQQEMKQFPNNDDFCEECGFDYDEGEC